jgi:hypothetical protein
MERKLEKVLETIAVRAMRQAGHLCSTRMRGAVA